MKTNKLMLSAVAVLGALCFSPASRADNYTVDIQQTGANQITTTGSGSVDLTGLTAESNGTTLDFISGSYFLTTGATPGAYTEYTGITGPANFGIGGGTTGIGTGTGDFVGINAQDDYLLLPSTYASGDSLNSMATYSGNFADLGLTDGTNFTYDLGNGSTFTVNVGTVAATPEPGSFALLGTGLLGFAGVMKRRLS